MNLKQRLQRISDLLQAEGEETYIIIKRGEIFSLNGNEQIKRHKKSILDQYEVLHTSIRDNITVKRVRQVQ
jgi:hypothetical protein